MGELEKNTMVEDEAFSFAVVMATASAPAMVLRVVTELNVFEILKGAGPGAHLSATEIAAQLPTKNPEAGPMLDRMLRLLAAHEVLSCSDRDLPNGQFERLYGLSPVSHFFTNTQDGASLAALSLFFQDKVFVESWYYLKEAILGEGNAFKKAHNMTIYEYPQIDDRFNKLLNEGMSDYSVIVMKEMLEKYKGFEGISTLVDVGGGIGTSLNMIISKYPTIRGINFDLPHAVKDAPNYNGIEHIGGDMFLSVPKGDAIFLKWVVSDWSDERCHKLLKNCYDALPNEGKVIVYDFLDSKTTKPSYATKMLLNLDALALPTLAGRRLMRTQREFEALAKGAGFEGFNMVCLIWDTYVVMELKKNN